MLTHKAVAGWPIALLTLIPICLGCTDVGYSRPNTLPRRTVYPTAQTATPSNAAVASNTSNTKPSSAWDQATAQLPQPDPIPTATRPAPTGGILAIPQTQAQAPAPAPQTQAQAPAPAQQPVIQGNAGSVITPVSAESAKPAVQPAVASGEPGPVIAPPPPAPVAGKVPMPPENENDPPPMPGTAGRRPASASDDPSSPPPIPSVVKPTPALIVTPNGAGAGDTMAQLRTVHRNAVERFKSIDSYIARFRRREQINGVNKPEELMLFKFRKKPWSVYFKWLGIEGHNRECVYVKGQHSGMIHTILAEGDVVFLPAGKRFSVSPDSALVKAKSRHTITEAGIGDLIDKFGHIVDVLEHGDHRYGTMKYLGYLRRPEFEKPHIACEQVIPAGAEAQLPRGGSRLWLFDPDNNLPVLLVTYDHANQEVEYYCYDRIIFSKLDDDDFNPDKLWPKR
jgi:hypothetical protein